VIRSGDKKEEEACWLGRGRGVQKKKSSSRSARRGRKN